jgi:hypothetical protein
VQAGGLAQRIISIMRMSRHLCIVDQLLCRVRFTHSVAKGVFVGLVIKGRGYTLFQISLKGRLDEESRNL